MKNYIYLPKIINNRLYKLLFITIVFCNIKTFAFKNIPLEKNNKNIHLNITPIFTQVTPICSGETFTLPTVSDNGISGTWSPAINNTQTTTYTFTPLVGQNATTATMTVVVNPTPTFISNGVNDTFTICSGESTNVVLSGNNPNITYVINVVSGNVVGAVSSSGSVFNNTILTLANGTTSGVVTYTITPTIGNCVGPEKIITINVNPVPFVFPGLTSIICSGEYTYITFSSSFPNTTFDWVVNSFSGVSGFSNGSGNLINDLLNTTGTSQGSVTYTVTPRIGNCIGNSSLVVVNVIPLPNNTITQTGATLTANQAGASYQWYKCPNFIIPGATTQTYLVTEIGDYKVEVVDISNGCMNTSNCINVSSLNIDSFESLSNLSIYPNPIESILTIENKYVMEKIEIFNLLGQTILSLSVNLNIKEIDLTNLSSGTYIVRVFSENNTINYKINKK